MKVSDLALLYGQALASGQTVEFSPTGNSMLPLLVGGQSLVRIGPVPPEGLKRGDVVLYRRMAAAGSGAASPALAGGDSAGSMDSAPPSYILHRVVQVHSPASAALGLGCQAGAVGVRATIDCVGDAQWQIERGIPVENVMGVMVAFSRAGGAGPWTSVGDQAYIRYWHHRLESRKIRSLPARAKRKVRRLVRRAT